MLKNRVVRAKTVVRNELETPVVWNMQKVLFVRSVLLLKKMLVEMFREGLRDFPDIRLGEDGTIEASLSLGT